MRNSRKLAAIVAATAALSMLAASSASAEDRHRDGTWRDNSTYRDNRGNNTYRDDRGNSTYRDHRNDRDNRSNSYRHETRNDSYRHESGHDRFNEHGRISRFTRERDGYRVWLGGERSYWIPSYRLGSRRLRVGLDLRLGGIFNSGYWEVDALGWPGDPYYADPYYGGGYYSDGLVSGIVERVDFRYGTMLLRDDRSGRIVNVDMRSTEYRRGLGLDDLHRGDRVTLTGSWDGGGLFRAYRIDGVRSY